MKLGLKSSGRAGRKSAEMLSLIDEFKVEHQGIMDLFTNIKRLGIHTQEGRDCLTSCKNKLLDHLKKEDRKFYPVILANEGLPADIRSLIKEYKREFLRVTQRAVDFFNKYSIGGGGIEFLQDFDRFKTELEDRIRREEEILFPAVLKFYQEKS